MAVRRRPSATLRISSPAAPRGIVALLRGGRRPYYGPMGVFDESEDAADKVRDAADKVKDVTEEQVDKLGELVDKAADKLDEKTGGKHSDKIDQVVDPLQNPVEATASTDERPRPPAP